MLRRPAPRSWARGLVLVGALAPAWCSGHDLWVLAGQYRLEPAETTRVFINSGDSFPESLSLLGQHRITEIALLGPAGKELISDFRVEDHSLSFEITPMQPGSHVIALATRTRRVRLKADDFTDYLTENRLEDIIALREEMGESEQPAVERYAKWAKALIDVGASGDDAVEDDPAWSKPVGHTIEIIPESDPSQLGPGDSLSLRVLYEGAPLAGASISGGRASGPAREILTKTDGAGRSSVTISSPGRWYLRAIHMIPRDDDPEVRWESFWCTMTFEVR